MLTANDDTIEQDIATMNLDCFNAPVPGTKGRDGESRPVGSARYHTVNKKRTRLKQSDPHPSPTSLPVTVVTVRTVHNLQSSANRTRPQSSLGRDGSLPRSVLYDSLCQRQCLHNSYFICPVLNSCLPIAARALYMETSDSGGRTLLLSLCCCCCC